MICNYIDIIHNPALKFEPSFVEIHQVLREIWLFEHEFQARNLGQV